MKTKKELKALKEEVEAVSRKLAELNEEELAQVSGGLVPIPNWRGSFIGLTVSSCPEEHNIMLTGDFTGNHANGSGGGVYNEGTF